MEAPPLAALRQINKLSQARRSKRKVGQQDAVMECLIVKEGYYQAPDDGILWRFIGGESRSCKEGMTDPVMDRASGCTIGGREEGAGDRGIIVYHSSILLLGVP